MAVSSLSSNKTILHREWRIPPHYQVDEQFIEAAEGSGLLATLLAKRGMRTAQEIRAFLDPTAYSPSNSMVFTDMFRAIARITEATVNKEKITVYGDFDVDGITATSMMVVVLQYLGADVDYYIPSRSNEGYGLNLKAISILASKHRTKLIITCDCGTSNFTEINFAKSLGVDTIILDHHSLPELLPPATAILHPKQLPETHALFDLSAVGIAYKLCEALLTDRGAEQEIPKLLDFVTLGLIADLVPLIRENRYLVQIGLPHLTQSPRVGIKALLAQTGKMSGTDLVGFALAPRINAVGRLSDANCAVELLTTQDEVQAQRLAQQLQNENLKRQALCEQIFFEADQQAQALLSKADAKAIVIFSSNWHHGVVGIVASKLVEKYHRPAFVGELNETENILKGSARSFADINLLEILKANEHLMNKWGGHKMAAGFTVEASKAELFQQAILATSSQLISSQALRPFLEIDLTLTAAETTLELVQLINKLAPFGIANKKPVFVMHRLDCINVRDLGKTGKHSQILLKDSSTGTTFDCVLWNHKDKLPVIGQIIDIAFTPELNSYTGREKLRLTLHDWLDPQASATPTKATAAEHTKILELDYAQEDNLFAPKKIVLRNETSTPESIKSGSRSISWYDLRKHSSAESFLKTAMAKLENQLAIFAECCEQLPGVNFVDRVTFRDASHLLIWSYPPDLKTFKSLLAKTSLQKIYLLGARFHEATDSTRFLKHMIALIRFAVNKKNGLASPEKLAAALGTSKISLALGLTILKKVSMISWVNKDDYLYFEPLGHQPVGQIEQLTEFRQLTLALKEVVDFRDWCSNSSLNEIQAHLIPNSIHLKGVSG